MRRANASENLPPSHPKIRIPAIHEDVAGRGKETMGPEEQFEQQKADVQSVVHLLLGDIKELGFMQPILANDLKRAGDEVESKLKRILDGVEEMRAQTSSSRGYIPRNLSAGSRFDQKTKLEMELQNIRRQMEKERYETAQEIEEWKNRYERLQEECQEQKATIRDTLEKHDGAWEVKMKEMEGKHERRRQWEKTLACEKEELFSRSEQKRKDAEQKMKAYERKLEEYKHERNMEQKVLQKEISGLTENITQLRDQHRRELEASKSATEKATMDFINDQEKLELKFARICRHNKAREKKILLDCKAEVEELKGLLLKREQAKDDGIADPKIPRHFETLAYKLDNLSRVPWDEEKEADWPYRNQDILNLNGENPRIVKKHIVQNTLWSILHKRIFATPFRVFGDYGMELEKEWMRRFGKGS